MPVAPTYPGVYIEEIPSGVRTITGVATSITAFIGRALRGPVNTPVTINSFGDFERKFGGLWAETGLGFAVRDFYLNGGSQAIIVRLFPRSEGLEAAEDVAAAAEASTGANAAAVAADARAKANEPANSAEPRKTPADAVADAAEAEAAKGGSTPASVKKAAADSVEKAAPKTRAALEYSTLKLEAASEGKWGNKLAFRVDHNVKPDTNTTIFNLTVKDTKTGVIEVFRNLSITETDPRYVNKVLANESDLVRAVSGVPAQRPNPAHKAAPPGKDPFDIKDDDAVVTRVKTANEVPSDGGPLKSTDILASEDKKEGLFALAKADLFNLLCIPPDPPSGDVAQDVWDKAAVYCQKRRAMLIVDPPSGWNEKDDAKDKLDDDIGVTSNHAAIYFPRVRQRNPLHDGQIEDFAPCGAVAGVMARTDTNRGVWKAPAGLAANLFGVPQLSVSLTDAENGELNPLGINCLRTFVPGGRVVWGARTLEGDDRLASEWKYVPVRRTALFIEESLYRGTQWVVFEPNDEPLWAQIRLNVGAFMHNLFRQGAFQGTTPRDAYFVKCDKETTTQNDINLGIVNIIVGFAPLKPAEFVIIKLQQMAGQIET